jgi:hypothetical protein
MPKTDLFLLVCHYIDDHGALPDALDLQDELHPEPVEVDEIQQAINDVKALHKWVC